MWGDRGHALNDSSNPIPCSWASHIPDRGTLRYRTPLLENGASGRNDRTGVGNQPDVNEDPFPLFLR
jgi:hypothetical protein